MVTFLGAKTESIPNSISVESGKADPPRADRQPLEIALSSAIIIRMISGNRTAPTEILTWLLPLI